MIRPRRSPANGGRQPPGLPANRSEPQRTASTDGLTLPIRRTPTRLNRRRGGAVAAPTYVATGWHHRVRTVLFGAFILMGCSDRSTSNSVRSPRTDSASAPAPSLPTQPNLAFHASGPVQWPSGPTGNIEGTVRFEGSPIPQATTVANRTDPAACGTMMSKNDIVISPETRGVRHVIISVSSLEPPAGYEPPKDHLVLDNRRCQFEPHAAAITIGSTVIARNSDDIWHSTHFQGQPLNDNPALPAKGVEHKLRARRLGFVQVKCDKHEWMRASIRVDSHPFHAVTDGDGRFAIPGVPVGEHSIEIIHEVFGTHRVSLSVQSSRTTTADLSYAETAAGSQTFELKRRSS